LRPVVSDQFCQYALRLSARQHFPDTVPRHSLRHGGMELVALMETRTLIETGDRCPHSRLDERRCLDDNDLRLGRPMVDQPPHHGVGGVAALRSSSGSLEKLIAIRLASSIVRTPACRAEFGSFRA